MRRTLVLIAGLLWGCPQPSMNPPAAMPCLIVTPSEIDFGEVENLNMGFERLQVSNPGRFNRTVTASTPLAFGISPVSVQLPPQSTRAFIVQFQPADALLHLGELELNGGQGCTATVRLRGLGQGSLTMVPELLDFGFMQPGERKTLELSVVNTRRTPVQIASAGFLPGTGTGFSAAVPSQFEMAPSSAVSFAVTASPPSDDAYQAVLQLGSAEGFLRSRFIVEGGAPVAELSPRAVHLPVVGFTFLSFPRSFADRVVSLRNASTRGRSTGAQLRLVPPLFEVELLEGGAVDELTVTLASELTEGLGLGAAAPLSLHFEPRSVGRRGYRVTLFTSDPVQPAQVFTFETNVQQLPACNFEISPPIELVLAPQSDGTSTGAVTFTNTGLDPCVVDDLRLDGSVPGFRLVNSEAQVTIAPGESHAVQIVGPRAVFGSTTVLGFHVFNRDSVREFINLQAPP